MKIDPTRGCVVFINKLKPDPGQGSVGTWIFRIWFAEQILKIKLLEVSGNTFSNKVLATSSLSFRRIPEVKMHVGFFSIYDLINVGMTNRRIIQFPYQVVKIFVL